MAALGAPTRPSVRHRVELRCMAEELAFARRLPVSEFPEAAHWIAGRLREEPALSELEAIPTM